MVVVVSTGVTFHSMTNASTMQEYRNARDAAVINFGVSLVGLASCAYFMLAEYLLGALCPLCTIVHVVVVITVYLGFQLCKERGVFRTMNAVALLDVGVARIGWLLLAFSVALAPVIVMNLPASPPQYEPEAVRQLATCLKQRGAKMYGLSKCSHCIAQKALFGDAFHEVDYTECSERKCEGVDGFPTWKLEGKEKLEGQQQLNALAKWAGCDELTPVVKK